MTFFFIYKRKILINNIFIKMLMRIRTTFLASAKAAGFVGLLLVAGAASAQATAAKAPTPSIGGNHIIHTRYLTEGGIVLYE
jgi:hypothetical protein